MLDCQFLYWHKSPVIIINQLKSIYNSPFKYLPSHPMNSHWFSDNGSNVALLEMI